MDAFKQQLDLMDQTASQRAETEDEKDETIRQLRLQVVKLKELLLELGDISEIKLPAVETDERFEVPSVQTQSVQKKDADEDPGNMWQICACHQKTCNTCNAEREAVVSANEWFDKTTGDGTAPDVTHKQVKSERKSYFCLRSLTYHTYDELQEVHAVMDHTFRDTGMTNKCIIHLHPTLSVNHLCYNRNDIHACGLIVLEFARKTGCFTPQLMFLVHGKDHILQNNVYETVKSAVQEGSDLYWANYGTQSQCLSAAEIVFLNRHLGLQLIEDIEIESRFAYIVTLYIMNLKTGQILLLIRMNEYNVWSAVSNNNVDVIIFDCQSTVRDGRLDGGMIYHIRRNFLSVIEALIYIKDHSGGFEGITKLALVQT